MNDYPLDSALTELKRLMRGRQLSPVELAASCLRRIEALNPVLNAFLAVTGETAMQAARDAERAYRDGEITPPLLGIPIALKDNIAVAGVPMTAGTRFLQEYIPERDAPVVTRLRTAGAVLVGKLNMHEWAIGATSRNPHFGPVRNPWDPQRIAGGSSGGSAAAVAAGMVPVSLGSDTGGSGRIPAALTGVSGLRPSTRLISTDDVVPMSWTFDTISPIARHAADVETLLHALSSSTAVENASLTDRLDGTRLGLLGGSVRADTDFHVWASVAQAAQTMEGMGAVVEEIELPGFEAGRNALHHQMMAEAAAYHEERLGERPELFGPDVLARLRDGARITGMEYGRARDQSRRWWHELEDVFTRYDLLILPTCGAVAPPVDESDGVRTTALLTRFTHPWSAARVPALSIPCGFVEGLPVGLQIVGPRGADSRVLWLGRVYQQATDWHRHLPDESNFTTHRGWSGLRRRS